MSQQTALKMLRMQRIEQIALLRLMLNLADIDGEFHASENKVFTKYAIPAAYTGGKIGPEEIYKISLLEATQVLRQLDQELKIFCQEALFEIVKADNLIDTFEVCNFGIWNQACDFHPIILEEQCVSLGLEDLTFKSSDHVRFEGQTQVAGPHNPPVARLIRSVKNIDGGEGYTIAVHTADGITNAWGDTYVVGPKPMIPTAITPYFTCLRGFGADPRAHGDPAGEFSNYGFDILHPTGVIDHIVLNLFDRGVRIVYFP